MTEELVIYAAPGERFARDAFDAVRGTVVRLGGAYRAVREVRVAPDGAWVVLRLASD